MFLLPSVCYSSSTTYDKAYFEAAAISNALKMYYLDTGSLPTGESGLKALLVAPSSVDGWRGPYLDRVPRDPWGNPYRYDNPGDGAETIRVYSLGRNGFDESGLGDDVTSLRGYDRSIYLSFWQRNAPLVFGIAFIVILSGIVLAVVRLFKGRRRTA